MNEYLASKAPPPRPLFPSPLDTFKWQFAHLEGAPTLPMGSARPMHPAGSLQRERVQEYQNEAAKFTSRHLLDEKPRRVLEEKAAKERSKSIDHLGFAVRSMTVSERLHPSYSGTTTNAPSQYPVRSNTMQPR